MEKVKKKNKRIIQIDQRTGQELRGTVVYFAPKRRIYPEGFITMSQEGLKAIYESPNLNKPELRLLILLLSEVDYENVIPYTQSEFTRRHNLNKSTVCRNWGKLVDEGILSLIKKIGQNKYYLINSEYAWKGKVRNYRNTHEHLELPGVQEFLDGVSEDDNSDEEDTAIL